MGIGDRPGKRLIQPIAICMNWWRISGFAGRARRSGRLAMDGRHYRAMWRIQSSGDGSRPRFIPLYRPRHDYSNHFNLRGEPA